MRKVILTNAEPNIGSGGQYHLSHTYKSRYWALQTPNTVLLLFCVKCSVDNVKTAVLLFIYYFFILVKTLLQIYIDF